MVEVVRVLVQWLAPFMPLPVVKKTDSGFAWATKQDYPQSIGRLSCFMGNAGILLRAYFYMKVLGKEGLLRVRFRIRHT